MKAYGGNEQGETRLGHVRLNGLAVLEAGWYTSLPNLRGVNVIRVDPFTCTELEERRFDTFADPTVATELSTFLQQLTSGSIVVVVTGDEPTSELSAALQTLSDMGADVSDVGYRGAFAFVAQKGFPAKTVLRKALTEAEAFELQPHITALVSGTIYLAYSESLVSETPILPIIRFVTIHA